MRQKRALSIIHNIILIDKAQFTYTIEIKKYEYDIHYI